MSFDKDQYNKNTFLKAKQKEALMTNATSKTLQWKKRWMMNSVEISSLWSPAHPSEQKISLTWHTRLLKKPHCDISRDVFWAKASPEYEEILRFMGNKRRATEWSFSSSQAAASKDHSVCTAVLASRTHKHIHTRTKRCFWAPFPLLFIAGT